MENYLLSQKFSSKISESLSNQPMPQPDTQDLRTSEIKLVSSFEDSCSSSARKQSVTTPPKYPQKLLLPKLEVAMVKLAVMQFSHACLCAYSRLFGPAGGGRCGSGLLRRCWLSALVSRNSDPWPESEACSLQESLSLSKIINPVIEPISTRVQMNLGKNPIPLQELGNKCQKNDIFSVNIQTGTDLCLTRLDTFCSVAWPLLLPVILFPDWSVLWFSSVSPH
jgi:hypothetical protein